MSGDYVNLSEVGSLTKSGRGYDQTGQDNVGESRNFVGRMEASQRGLRGSAGRTFSGIADMHGGNVGLLANQMADQAMRAVRGEQTVVAGDDEADGAQSGTVATVDAQTTAVTRPINA